MTHGLNIPGSYARLFFTVLDLTFTIRHPQWVSFLLWPGCFILSGAVSNFCLHFPSSILDSFQPTTSFFWCHIFLPFHTVHGVLTVRILIWFAIPPPLVDYVLWELFTMICLSWMVLHDMAYSFIELHKPFCHDMVVIHEGNYTSNIEKFNPILLDEYLIVKWQVNLNLEFKESKSPKCW